MPQDSFRSVVYRSFVTCDDPKGVVEDATIRKSKTDSQKMEGKIRTERERQLKILIKFSSSYKGVEKDICGKKAEENLEDNPSSFQLMEVKKGAQKLNQVIDSWSKGDSFGGRQSKYIAKDLLRGALDLQESLAMLGKLQEASHYMTRLKKEEKEKEKVYEMGIERTSSERLEKCNLEMGGFQKARNSIDGSSRDCYEELRDVILEGLGRQNLLPKGSFEQRVFLDRKKVELSPDIPSTSSSRSSVAHSYEFASTDSFSSKMPEEKLKGSNLIAKLMGLEDVSSKSSQSTPQKKLDRDNKAFSLRRPVFDIDLPMTRKPQFVVQKVDREPMTLDKIIEAMHSKGLLRSHNHQRFHTNLPDLEKRFGNDSPPIVLMKPHLPEVSHTCSFHQETKVFENVMAQKWKPVEDFPPKIKKVDSFIVHEKEMFIKKPHKEKKVGDIKERVEKTRDEEVKVTGKSPKVKVSASASPKPQKKEVFEKKVDKIQKLAPNRKKPLEKVTLSKETKPEARSASVKGRQISPQKTSTATPIQKTRTTSPIRKRPSLQKSSDHKKNVKIEKPVKKPVATNVEKNGCQTDEKQIDISFENESDLIIMEAIPAVQILDVEKMDAASAVRTEEVSDYNQHSLSEATLFTEHVNGFDEPEEVNSCSSSELNKSNSLDRNNDSNELFDIDSYRAIVLQAINFPEASETANSKLLLDYANELLEQKSLRQISAIHPLLQKRTIKPRFCISVDQLTREAIDGLENLSGYCKCTKVGPRADVVHGMLDRDLWRKGDVGGAWDMGWRDGFSLEEIEEIVGDLEKVVLSELIEGVLGDFFCVGIV